MQLPEDIEWHFIGNLQSNKVKPLLGMVHLLSLLVLKFWVCGVFLCFLMGGCVLCS
jgi:hypothetical protein